jgi:hypothetical protein
MQSNSNYSDLLRSFNEDGVRYLVVGGYAVMKYTEPYLTKDLNIWIDPTPENAQLVFAALARFGAPLSKVTVEDLIAPDIIYQVGVDYNRIDVISHLPGGISFADAWSRHQVLDYDGVPAPVLAEDDLIVTKRVAGRKRDLLAVEAILKAKKVKANKGGSRGVE